MTKKNSGYIAVRVTPALKDLFLKKASKYGDRSEVHRELLEAFVQDRLSIRPNSEQKFDKLYEENK